MDRQVLPLRWMLAGAKRYARKRRVYTRDHDTITNLAGRKFVIVSWSRV